MKRITIAMFCLMSCILVKSQESVIVLDGNVASQKNKTYYLPLKISFDALRFKDANVEVRTTSGKSIASVNLADNEYYFSINEEKKLQVPSDPQPEIPENAFVLEHNGVSLGTFSIKGFKTAYTPGFMYYDALKLKELKDITDVNDSLYWLKCYILKYYNVRKKVDLENNKFLENIVNVHADSISLYSNLSNQDNILSMVSSVGSFNITTIADGMAKFIVKRTKEEMNVAFFEKFQKELDKYPDLKTVFPCTYSTLTLMGTEIYAYESYLKTMRESFYKDLNSLPYNLPTIISNHEDYFSKEPYVRSELLTAFYMAQGFQENMNPGEIIENYDVSILDDVDSNIKAVFQAFQLFSVSLKDSSARNYWVSYNDVKKLVNDQTAFAIYLGLVAQRAHDDSITFKYKQDGTLRERKMFDLMNDTYTQLKPYKTYLVTLASKVQSLNAEITKLDSLKNDSLRFESYYQVTSSTIDVMRYCVQADQLPLLKTLDIDLQTSTKPYVDLAQTSADMVIDVRRKNYAMAIVHAGQIMNITGSILKYPKGVDIGKLKANMLQSQGEYEALDSIYNYAILLERIKQRDGNITESAILVSKANGTNLPVKDAFKIAEKVLNSTSYSNKLGLDVASAKDVYEKRNKESNEATPTKTIIDLKETSSKVLKYGTFMAAIVKADSSEQVAAIIEAMALPCGSSRIKRETKYNVSVNAYCGLFTGYEQIKNVDYKFKLNSYGVTAPIGLSFSIGKQIFLPLVSYLGEKDRHWSHTIFFSLVDIGALAAFRFEDDSTRALPNMEVKDIISPGVFYSIGIPKTPVSVNVGYQVGPRLRKVTSESNTIGSTYSRWSISVCVDLPLLNLYTSSR